MRDFEMHLMHFDYLYKKGIIKKDTYDRAIRDVLRNKRKLVSIKSTYNNEYVSVDGESNVLAADSDEVDISERFDLIDLGNGVVIFQSNDGYYIKSDEETNILVANETERAKATLFTLMPINEKEVALKTDKGYYVKINESDILVADEPTQGDKTIFKIKEITQISYDDIVMISILEERFVSATNGGGSSLTATEFNQSDNEEFTVIYFLDDTIAIQTDEDYYVRVRDDNNLLWADAKNITEATRFTGENLGNNIIVLKTLDGSIVRVREMDKYLIADGNTIDESSKFNIYQSTRPD